VDAAKISEDSLMESALDAGAEDVQREDEQFIVSTAPSDFHTVQNALRAAKVEIVEAELAMVPKNTVQIAGKDAESLLKLLETIEELDDVQKVWANFDIDVAEMAKVEG
jgi:transcriptional/translational regulatory protein YebC/TACO1